MLEQLDKTKNWVEKQFDMLSNYIAKDLTGWRDLVSNLQGVNREHVKHIFLLEKDKDHLIQALKSRDRMIAELLGQEGNAGPSLPDDEE